MAKGPVIKDVSNPAAVGLEWETTDGRYQLAWPRGTSRLMLGIWRDGMWHTVTVDNPGYVVTPETTGVDARLIMRRFIAAGSE